MKKVKFLRHVTTKTQPEDQESFKAGQEVELSNESAQHWINRGAAEEVKAPAKAEAKTPPSPPIKSFETKP